MRIKDKLYMNYDELIEKGPITIVALGDSVTHGAVAAGEMDYETVYHNRLRQKILAIRDYVPVNVINAGIGGINTTRSLGRIEAQVTSHNPDLVIVCFGLNELGQSLDVFLGSLGTIFKKCLKCGADVIYMTPNMMNTYVADDTPKQHYDYAHVTADYMNSGKMDRYIEAASDLAEKMGVTVCDCYAEWKKLSETQDTTLLLANRINHPTKEMHGLFADMLFDTIFGDGVEIENADNNTMYRGD